MTRGIEPLTSCVTGKRSNLIWTTPPSVRLLILTSSCLNKLGSFNEVVSSIGWNGGTRTRNPSVNSRVLYQLSYEPICCTFKVAFWFLYYNNYIINFEESQLFNSSKFLKSKGIRWNYKRCHRSPVILERKSSLTKLSYSGQVILERKSSFRNDLLRSRRFLFLFSSSFL